jgi:hypothetical protein
MPRKRLTGGRAVRGFPVGNVSAGDERLSDRRRTELSEPVGRGLVEWQGAPFAELGRVPHAGG